MKKIFRGIILSLYFCTAVAAESEALQAEPLKESFTVHITGQKPFTLRTTREALYRLNMIKQSFECAPETTDIFLREDFSKEDFELLIEYLQIDPLELDAFMNFKSRSFLEHNNNYQIITPLAAAFGLTDELGHLTCLILYIFKKVPFPEFEEYIQKADGFAVTNVLKQLQLIVFKHISQPMGSLEERDKEKRNLAGSMYLDVDRVACLKKLGLLNFTISVADLYTDEETRHLVTPRDMAGCKALNLSNLFITHLDGIETVPNPEEILAIFLNSNQIKTFKQSHFAPFTQLQILDSTDNHIETIEPTTFSFSPHLKELCFRNNKIHTLTSDTFASLPNLEKLWLDYNEITTIAPATFRPLSKLRWLYLNDNHISTIERNTFASLPQLDTLWLFNNPLEEPKLPHRSFWKRLFKKTDTTTPKDTLAITTLAFAGLALPAAQPKPFDIKKIVRDSVPENCEIRFEQPDVSVFYP